ncbi:MAG: VOC family protein [Thermodesulfobacteriota bacterium]|nr:VOC family protein [Thermodesulfobacteriota bacterium]
MRSPLESANTILYCARWEETVSFYKEGLGLGVTFSTGWFVEFALTGSARLSIADARHATVRTGPEKGMTLSLEVDDLQAAWNALRDAGLVPGEIKSHAWNARVFYLFDPEGHRLEFWQRCVPPHE